MNRALRAAAMGVLLLSPVALSACSAGQVAQTAAQQRDKVGGQAQVGDITVREAQLAYPTGGQYARGSDARLIVAVVNGSQSPDTLLSISGDGFAGAQVTGAAGATPTTTAGSTGSSTSASTTSSSPGGTGAPSTGTTSSTGTPTATASPTSSATPSSSAGASGGGLGVAVPPQSNLYIGGDGPVITLTGLKRALTPGQSMDVTMRFARAGDIPVTVLVGSPTRDLPRGAPFDFHQQQGGGAA